MELDLLTERWLRLKKRLTKSEFNRSISGVCGGITNYFDISALFVRVIFSFLSQPI
nr:PspC domain-containing protein [Paenibacillus lupini]